MFEMTARWAGWSKSKGLIYYSASGAWAPSSCPLNNISVTGSKIPFSDEFWREEDAGLTKVNNMRTPDTIDPTDFLSHLIFTQWLPTKRDVQNEKDIQEMFYKAHPSVSRFTGWAADGSYRGIGPHGFNVWEGNPNCQMTRDGKVVKGIFVLIHQYYCKLKIFNILISFCNRM